MKVSFSRFNMSHRALEIVALENIQKKQAMNCCIWYWHNLQKYYENVFIKKITIIKIYGDNRLNVGLYYCL